MGERFGVAVERVPEGVVMRLHGYLAREGGEQLHAAVVEQLRGGATEVTLDFSEVPVINSLGVSLLLNTIMTIPHEFGGRAKVCGLSESLTHFLEMMGILGLVEHLDA